jgi:hypothetical protein
MTKKKENRWVRLWRSWRGGRVTDTYVRLEYLGSDEEKDLKDAAEEWGENQLPGSEFSYGYEIVAQPPREWLDKEIERLRDLIANSRKEITSLMKILPGGGA